MIVFYINNYNILRILRTYIKLKKKTNEIIHSYYDKNIKKKTLKVCYTIIYHLPLYLYIVYKQNINSIVFKVRKKS